MLVSFYCDAAGSVTMQSADALALLGLMGLAGSVPGSLAADDVAGVLCRLGNVVAAIESPHPPLQSVKITPSTLQRARQLFALLSVAAVQGCDVRWSERFTKRSPASAQAQSPIATSPAPS